MGLQYVLGFCSIDQTMMQPSLLFSNLYVSRPDESNLVDSLQGLSTRNSSLRLTIGVS